MSRILWIISVLGFTLIELQAQQFVFATLDGSPNMNTTGWNLTGAASIGDTPGDLNSDPDEMILCNDTNWTSGACFYGTPLDINICNKWAAEFDYRINDGSAADGIGFCFLANPPTGFVNGGNIGIPSNPQGLMVVLDVFDNCGGVNPELQIRYGTGVGAYEECPTTAQPTLFNQTILRDTAYNHMRISYNDGAIQVFINGTLYLTGFFQTNYSGFLGFTAATGLYNDNHSIKNVVIYTSPPPSNAGPDSTICSGDNFMIGTAPSAGLNYVWTPATNLTNANIANPMFSVTNNGPAFTYHTYIVQTDSLGPGCASFDTVTISVEPNPQVILSADTMICKGETSVISTSGFGNFIWADNNTTFPRTVAPDSTATYVVVSQNQACPDISDSITINVVPFGGVEAGPDQFLCSGDGVRIGDLPNNGYSYSWSPTSGLSNATSSNPMVSHVNNSTTTQTYTYIVTADSAGCSVQDTVLVTVDPENWVDAGPDIDICPGDSITVTAAGFDSVYWVGGTGSATLVDWPTSNTNYIAGASGDICPTAYDTVMVTVGLSGFQMSDDTTILLGESFQIVTTGNWSSYQWSPALIMSCSNCGNPIVSPDSTTTYTVIVTDENGCQLTDSVTIYIEIPTQCDGFEVASAFTPNNDGRNDVLPLYEVGVVELVIFKIYNRWGQEVFETADKTATWDGTFKDKPQDQGTFVYYLIYQCEGQETTKSGNITLIR